MSEGDLCAQAGGFEGIKAVVADFYKEVFEDVMIGYLFVGVDRERLIQREAEFAAVMLGDREIEYTGRPLRAAHGPHHILSGHFDRRLQILKEALEAHGMPEAVKARWIEHTASLRAQIVDPGMDCAPPA